MNKLKYIILFVPLLYIGASCKKQQLLTYDIKDNVYFNFIQQGTVLLDTVNVSFAYSPTTVQDSTIMIPVQVTGAPIAQDREYSVSVDPSSTEAATGHYVLPGKFIMPAGKVIDSLPVKLLRAKDLQDTVKNLILNLSPNQNFNTDIKISPAPADTINLLSFKINVSDILLAGPYWNSVFATYFGTFSVKKVRLLNQIVGMPLNFPINGIYDLNLSADAALYAIAMSRYLKDQATAGYTIYEDDGITPMTMGTSYQ
jgi:hypothetical protein